MEEKTIKVTIEKENSILTIEGDEAQKWSNHCSGVCVFAEIHGCNPFATDKINWVITQKDKK